MPYQLVFTEPESELKGPTLERGAGSVFFDNLPADYKVYLFYYSGVNVNNDLVKKLKAFGKITGQNLYVNIGRLDDPSYRKAVAKFGIRKFPTLIVTAVESLASPPGEDSTPCIKIDDKNFINSTEAVFQFLEKTYNLFMDLRIAEAMKEKNKDLRAFHIKGFLNDALKGLSGYLKEWTFSLSLLEGKFEIKPKGG